MRIVIDTNVVISGFFFGGSPGRVIDAIIHGSVDACASYEIVNEYRDIFDEFLLRKQGHLEHGILDLFISKLDVIEPSTVVELSRDPDDDKFIECAVDAKALYIVSGDKDLLDLQQYDNVSIITATQFCEQYLSDL